MVDAVCCDSTRSEGSNCLFQFFVDDYNAFEWFRKIAQTEGLLVGPTSGAIARIAAELSTRESLINRTMVWSFYDTGERYLTTPDLFST